MAIVQVESDVTAIGHWFRYQFFNEVKKKKAKYRRTMPNQKDRLPFFHQNEMDTFTKLKVSHAGNANHT